jgi:hypothetical protein
VSLVAVNAVLIGLPPRADAGPRREGERDISLIRDHQLQEALRKLHINVGG